MISRRRRAAVLAAAVLASAVSAAAPAALSPVAAANGGASPGGTQAPAPGTPSTGATDTFSAAGGGSGSGGSATGGAESGTTGGAVAGSTIASANANGITIRARATALLRRRATVAGTAPAQVREVRIEQLGADGGWSEVAIAAVARDGRFAAAWRPRRLGAQELRAVAAGSATRAADAPPQVAVTVYRPGLASWYGPGFYGGRTACGVRLRKTTLGVAHKTLPCGTQVQFHYAGRTLVVPVIDRGPFVDGRSWDLTKYTHTVLGGDDGLILVGALPQFDAPRVATPYQARPMPGR